MHLGGKADRRPWLRRAVFDELERTPDRRARPRRAIPRSGGAVVVGLTEQEAIEHQPFEVAARLGVAAHLRWAV